MAKDPTERTPRDEPSGAPEAPESPTKRSSKIWIWTERAVWIVVVGILIQRFGPQLAATVGLERDLGPMPEFAVRTLDGAVVDSEELRGKVVLVNFWATWCGPCRLEMPGFQNVYDDLKGDGFVILGLATDRDGPAVVSEFLQEHDIDYPVAMATGDLQVAFGGLRGLPTSFLIDREGQITSRVYGIFAPPAMRMAVRQLLRKENGS